MNVLETGQLEHMAFWLFTNAPGLLLDLSNSILVIDPPSSVDAGAERRRVAART